MNKLRKCNHCSKRKEDIEFSAKYKIKNTGRCKECDAARMRVYYRDNRDSIIPKKQEYNKDYIVENKEKVLQYKTDWRNKNKHTAKYKAQQKARNAVSVAISKGKLVREACEICGSSNSVQAHHWSYADRWKLSVIWLCKPHHYEVHKKENV